MSITRSSTPSALPGRLYFLDWVRIVAFFVLIVFHVGMYYVTWYWMIKSPHASSAAEPFMMLSSPWRLSLLFLVSGVASGTMLARTTPGAFVLARRKRLILPLLVGVFVIVPPQAYLEVVEKLGYDGDYLDFMRLYLTGYHGFRIEGQPGGRMILPTWNHLWFVAYLWVYTLVLALLAKLLGPRWQRLAARTAEVLTGWRLVALPSLVLALGRMLLADRFPQTHAMVGDWAAHAYYLPAFLLGALLAHAPEVWPRMEAQRRACLALALASWAVFEFAGPPAWLRHPLFALLTWTAIVAACGFARRHLDRDGPARRYLAEAVFPVYILHQTLIVLLAHAFEPLQIAPGIEALLLIVLTTAGSFAGFECVRRIPLLRPAFGLGSRRPPAAGGQTTLAGAA